MVDGLLNAIDSLGVKPTAWRAALPQLSEVAATGIAAVPDVGEERSDPSPVAAALAAAALTADDGRQRGVEFVAADLEGSGPPRGPWKPPSVKPGSRTFTYTHIYRAVGRFLFHIQVNSANSAAAPEPDPYASYNPSIETIVTVQ